MSDVFFASVYSVLTKNRTKKPNQNWSVFGILANRSGVIFWKPKFWKTEETEPNRRLKPNAQAETQRHNSKDTPPHDLNRVNFQNKQVYQTTPNNKQTNNQATRHKRKIIILSLEHLSCKRNIVFLSWNIALLHKKKIFLSLWVKYSLTKYYLKIFK